jgi:biopolymer transport protein ExbD
MELITVLKIKSFVKKERCITYLVQYREKTSRFDLSVDENGNLIVTDTLTDTPIEARKITSNKNPEQKKWAIKYDDNKTIYFNQKQIDTCLLRKQITAIPQSVLNRRNNVEATIFQLGYHYSNDKSRYRGLVKHKMWAIIRCLWVNFVRIANAFLPIFILPS